MLFSCALISWNSNCPNHNIKQEAKSFSTYYMFTVLTPGPKAMSLRMASKVKHIVNVKFM